MSARRNVYRVVVALLGMSTLAALALGDRLVLKDGKVLEGTVIKQSDKYWVKTTDGQTQTIPMSDVDRLERGSGGFGSSSATGGAGALRSRGAPESLMAAQRRANSCDTALAAVTVWQNFIDSKPSAADLKTAQDELAKWKGVAEEGGERINGRWVTGDEYRALMSKYRGLMKEAAKLLNGNELLKGAEKIEEARRIYPNDFAVNFQLGFIEMKKNNWEKAIPYFENVLRLKPNLPEAMANIALAEWMKVRRFSPEPVIKMDRAAKQGDNKEIAFDLLAMLSSAPPTFLRNGAGKEALEDARLLGSKYAINPGEVRGGKLYIVGLHEESVAEHGRHTLWSGSGFILDHTGLILTNRHVAKDAKTLMVMLHDGQSKEMTADPVVIDDEQDLALIRLREVPAGTTLPIVQLAPSDMPADGAECTVIGYPMVDRLGGSPKITHGIVSSSLPTVAKGKSGGLLSRGSDDFDVFIDAKVNPGNSGGPILDRFGNVMAIVCMKSLSSETEDSYGMGISAGRIRRFLAKNHVKVENGTKSGAGLSVEEIAAKIEPATVLILATGK